MSVNKPTIKTTYHGSPHQRQRAAEAYGRGSQTGRISSSAPNRSAPPRSDDYLTNPANPMYHTYHSSPSYESPSRCDDDDRRSSYSGSSYDSGSSSSYDSGSSSSDSVGGGGGCD